MLSQKENMLLEALSPEALAQGVEIVTIEIVGSRKAPTIRVYIDTDHGVGFDELAASQVWVNEIVERIDPFPGAYTLEVSSPGIDRPLRTPDHFRRFVGQTTVLKTTQAVCGRSNFTAQIMAATDDELTLSCEGAEYVIPFALIKKAHLKGIIEFNTKE